MFPGFSLDLHTWRRAGWPLKREWCCGRKLNHFTPAVNFPTKVTDEVSKACRNSCAERKWDASFQRLCLQVTVVLSGLLRPYSHNDLPVPWPRRASPPHQRSWSWPRWWTDSPPTQTCRPAPAVASSGIPAPTIEHFPGEEIERTMKGVLH